MFAFWHGIFGVGATRVDALARRLRSLARGIRELEGYGRGVGTAVGSAIMTVRGVVMARCGSKRVFIRGCPHFAPHPLTPSPTSRLRRCVERGKKPRFSGSPSPRNEVELERGRGVRRKKAANFLIDTPLVGAYGVWFVEATGSACGLRQNENRPRSRWGGSSSWSAPRTPAYPDQ
jgi:hypothetical protein